MLYVTHIEGVSHPITGQRKGTTMSVSAGHYEKVRNKIEKKGLGVVAAINAVAKETGLKPGSIQTAYYRIAREKGQTRELQTQQRRIEAKEFNIRSNQPLDMLMGNIVSGLNEMVTRVQELEGERERLRQIEEVFSKS